MVKYSFGLRRGYLTLGKSRATSYDIALCHIGPLQVSMYIQSTQVVLIR